MLNKLKFLFLLSICSSFLFSQKIIRHSDGSISIVADTTIYLDTSGAHINLNVFQDSLGTGNYDISSKEVQKGIVEIQLIKRDLDGERTNLQLGKEFPPLELVDINLNNVNLEKNAITLLIFWNINCGPCIEELITFNTLAKEYPEINFLAMTSTSKQDINTFLQKRGFKWDNLIIIPDCQEHFDTFKIHTVPLNVIIDKDRIIKKISTGKKIRKTLLSLEDLLIQ